MITYSIYSNLCKKSSLQCYGLSNFPSFRYSHWKCSVRKGVLGNFANVTRKHLWQSLIFNKLAGWGNCFWSFSCLLLKISCLFRFKRKNEIKKGKYPDGVKIFTFFVRVSICLMSKISKEIWEMEIWSEKRIAIFMGRGISLGKSFWVVKTWWAPERKRLKGSTLNFAHTLLTDCGTKPCPRFS